MDRTEARKRIEAAERELAAAKAALEQAHEPNGRVIMKPSEVPVGEYFRFADEKPYGYKAGVRYKGSPGHYFLLGGDAEVFRCVIIDHRPVYLTDPYGNAIEPCERLPGWFKQERAIESLSRPRALVDAFSWSDTNEGHNYWEAQMLSGLSPSAAAKLRGMIHKWNQENGGQG